MCVCVCYCVTSVRNGDRQQPCLEPRCSGKQFDVTEFVDIVAIGEG